MLMVKGLKSMWRQAAPILRTTLQGVLQRIIMQVPTTPLPPKDPEYILYLRVEYFWGVQHAHSILANFWQIY